MYLLGNFNSNASKYLYLSLTIETRQEGTTVLVKIFTPVPVLQAADSDHVIILTLTLCREAEVLIDHSNHGKTWYSIYSMLTNHKQLWKWFYISYISFLYIWHLACAHLVWYISMLIFWKLLLFKCRRHYPPSLPNHQDSVSTLQATSYKRLYLQDTPKLLTACRMMSCNVMQDTVTVSVLRRLLPHLISLSRRRFPELNTSNCETDHHSHQALISAAFIHSWRPISLILNFFQPICF